MAGAASGPAARPVSISTDGVRLEGILSLPDGASSVVLFAHGSGSGRHSPRNNYVARVLQQAGLGTLLLDLLEEREASDRQKVFDIELLSFRLQAAATWLTSEYRDRAPTIGYFGASTGAGAALRAAALAPENVGAVVSRGGRPDLAVEYLPQVQAPTLLIVGGHDPTVIEMNQFALEKLLCERDLVIVPGAGHLFEEPGTLEEVARQACDWFLRYLPSGSPHPRSSTHAIST